MQMHRPPPPVVIGRDITIRGPAGVTVKIDTGAKLPRTTLGAPPKLRA